MINSEYGLIFSQTWFGNQDPGGSLYQERGYVCGSTGASYERYQGEVELCLPLTCANPVYCFINARSFILRSIGSRTDSITTETSTERSRACHLSMGHEHIRMLRHASSNDHDHTVGLPSLPTEIISAVYGYDGAMSSRTLVRLSAVNRRFHAIWLQDSHHVIAQAIQLREKDHTDAIALTILEPVWRAPISMHRCCVMLT